MSSSLALESAARSATSRGLGEKHNASKGGGTGEEPSRSRFWLILLGLLLTSALASLDHFIVNPALPVIASEFGGLAQLSWVMTGFMLASTVAMPLYGKFSDIHGRRLLFCISVALFLFGSLLCGISQSMLQLIVFRAIQGLGGGGVQVLAMTALGDIVSPRERPRFQGLFSLTNLLASVSGPVVGGLVTEWVGWRWVFYINLPVGLVALALLLVAMPRQVATRRLHRIDFPGVGLLICGTVSFLLLLGMLEGSHRASAPEMAGAAFVCLLSFTLLVRQERRAEEPILAVHLLANPIFARTVLSSGMVGLAFFGASVFLPLYFQMVGGYSTAQSGLMIMPHLIAGTTMSLLGGQVVSRTGRYKPPIVGGMALLGVGFAGLMAATALEMRFGAWVCCLLMTGSGGGLCMPNLMVALQNTVPRKDLGLGTASMQFCNQLAAVAGVGISGLVLMQQLRRGAEVAFAPSMVERVLSEGAAIAASLSSAQHAAMVRVYEQAFIWTFGMSCALAFVAALVATRIPEVHLSDTVG